MSRRAVLAVLALAGCDRVFGVAFSGEPAVVTGTISRDEVRNDASFRPVHVVGPATDVDAEVAFVDGTRQQVDVAADGSFTFETPDRSPYRLRLRTGDHDIEIQQFSERLDYVFPFIGRTDRTLVDGTEQIAIDATGVMVAGDQAWFSSTGIYSYARVAPALQQTFAYAPPTASGLGAPLGRLDAAANDRAYFALLGSVTEPADPTRPHFVLRDSLEGPLTMSGGTVTLAGALQPPPPPEQLPCREVVPTARVEAQRLAALRPHDGITVYWSIDALFAPEIAPFASLLLAYFSQFYTTPDDILDVPRTVRVHDPYPGSTLGYEALVVMRRFVALGGAAPVSLSTVSSQIVLVGSDLACSAIGTTPSIGVPATISLAGQPLATDGSVIALPGDETVDVAWDMAIRGIGDLWAVLLYRIVVNETNQTRLEHVRNWNRPSGDERAFSVEVDPSAFVPGETYAFQLVHRSGYPRVSEGDYTALEYPSQTIIVWSSTFVVE